MWMEVCPEKAVGYVRVFKYGNTKLPMFIDPDKTPQEEFSEVEKRAKKLGFKVSFEDLESLNKVFKVECVKVEK